MSQILTKIGITLWVAGFICVLASAAHRQPGVTFRELFWRGSFQRREDYTPEGWRLLWAGTILAIVGFALFAAASFYA